MYGKRSVGLVYLKRRGVYNVNEKVKVSFIDATSNGVLGKSVIPFGAVTKLNIGDRIEFKDRASLFGVYEIKSFAVNHGFPEGQIFLEPMKAKAKIRLHEINDELLENELPF